MFILQILSLDCLSAYLHSMSFIRGHHMLIGTQMVKHLVSACIRIYVFIIQDVTKSFELAILQESLGGNPRTATGMDGTLPH